MYLGGSRFFRSQLVLKIREKVHFTRISQRRSINYASKKKKNCLLKKYVSKNLNFVNSKKLWNWKKKNFIKAESKLNLGSNKIN